MTRLTVHQRKLLRVRVELEDKLAAAVFVEYQRLLRPLVVHLRAVEKHRPRYGLVKSTFLSPSLWELFRDRMRKRIAKMLNDGTLSIVDIAVAFWTQRTGQAVNVDTGAIAASLEATLAQRVKDIETSLRREIQRKVTAWYNTPGAKLSDIITELTAPKDGPLSRSRAETVARTEITRLNSGVHEALAVAVGADEWTFQTRNDATVCRRNVRWMRGPDGQMYTGCRELHGRTFKVGMPMPPESTHPNCRCSPSLVVKQMVKPVPQLAAPAVAVAETA